MMIDRTESVEVQREMALTSLGEVDVREQSNCIRSYFENRNPLLRSIGCCGVCGRQVIGQVYMCVCTSCD